MGLVDKLKKLFFGKTKEPPRANPAWKETLEKLLRTSVSLSFGASESSLPLTCSKFGGCPALPENFVWPVFCRRKHGRRNKETPLSFLLQINLEEFSPFDEDKLLPPRGMLYFFYEVDSMCWGFGPEDEGCARVYFYDGDLSALSPVRPPENRLFDESRLTFGRAPSLPSWEEYSEYNDAEMSSRAYGALLADFGVEEKEEGEDGKLLGYADVIQGEMLTDCEQAVRSLSHGDGSPETDIDDEEDVYEKGRDWTLLLQLGTVNVGNTELMWGDCGRLYFYIKKRDLASKNFDNVWMILQSC